MDNASSLERFPEESPIMSSDPDSSTKSADDIGIVEKCLEEQVVDEMPDVIAEIIKQNRYPELGENVKTAAMLNNIKREIKRRKIVLSIEELEDDEQQRQLVESYPNLMNMYEIFEEALDETVGVWPESRMNMLFDSMKSRRERDEETRKLFKIKYDDEIILFKSLNVVWRNYAKLQEIYPELLESPESIASEVSRNEIKKLEEKYGAYPGLIKKTENVKELSDIELFSLIYVLDISEHNMHVANNLPKTGVVETIENVRLLQFRTAKRFLIYEVQKRTNITDKKLVIKKEFVRWYYYHINSFSLLHDNVFFKDTLGDALMLELLMRTMKDGYGQNKKIKSHLPEKEDWRNYELPEGALQHRL
ncbi:MAG: hypothetical protein ACOX6Q_01845 [Candidatus Dojkabacteria bacterium]|jgi:hypothetical protein